MSNDEMTGLGLQDFASAFVERANGVIDMEGITLDLSALKLAEMGFMVGGMFQVECWDADGHLKWRDSAKNGVTTVGLDHVLNVVFRGTTPITTWYMGIVDNSGWTAFALADTAALHSGWSEVSSSDVSNSTRPSWSPGAPASSAIVNASTVDFNMVPASGTRTIKGLFLISNATWAGTSGTLWSTASFSGGTQTVSNGDTLKVTYTISAANNASNS